LRYLLKIIESMKYFAFIVVLFIEIGLLARIHSKINPIVSQVKTEHIPTFTDKQIDSVKTKALKEDYNTEMAVFINYGKFSGKDRFYLVDLETRKVILSGLCCHGGGYGNDEEKVVFSNVTGSHCSSEGFYKIGYPYTGIFGKAYKLYGLSSTNSNAFERFIVLHSHDCVPETEVNSSICESQGCPTLAPQVFLKLSTYLDVSKKPVLMWIYSLSADKKPSPY